MTSPNSIAETQGRCWIIHQRRVEVVQDQDRTHLPETDLHRVKTRSPVEYHMDLATDQDFLGTGL